MYSVRVSVSRNEFAHESRTYPLEDPREAQARQSQARKYMPHLRSSQASKTAELTTGQTYFRTGH